VALLREKQPVRGLSLLHRPTLPDRFLCTPLPFTRVEMVAATATSVRRRSAGRQRRASAVAGPLLCACLQTER